LIAISGFIVMQLFETDPTTPMASNEPKTKSPAPFVTADSSGIKTDTTKSIQQLSTGSSATAALNKEKQKTNEYLSMAKPEVATSVGIEPSKEIAASSAADEPMPSNAEVEVVAADSTVAQALQGRAAGVRVTQVEPVVMSGRAERKKSKEADSNVSKSDDELPTAYRYTPSDSIQQPSAMDDGIPGASKQIRERVALNRKVIRGRVISADDGNGLPGVNINIKGTNLGTVTDGEGNYQLPLDEPDPSLVFTFIGMESQEVKIEDAHEVNVALNQDMTQLSEVVVVGFDSEKALEDEGRLEFASPVGGRSAFKQYLETSLVYPQLALQNNIEGRVTIQFTVETSGDLSNFKVIRGIGYGCDEEVIRLVKKGPKWSPTRRDTEPITGRMRVRVKFRLPKK
jgi:TonB family protein